MRSWERKAPIANSNLPNKSKHITSSLDFGPFFWGGGEGEGGVSFDLQSDKMTPSFSPSFDAKDKALSCHSPWHNQSHSTFHTGACPLF